MGYSSSLVVQDFFHQQYQQVFSPNLRKKILSSASGFVLRSVIYMISMCRVLSLITGVYHQYMNQPFFLMGQLAFDRVLLLLYFLSNSGDGVILEGWDWTSIKDLRTEEPAIFFMHWIESMDLINEIRFGIYIYTWTCFTYVIEPLLFAGSFLRRPSLKLT